MSIIFTPTLHQCLWMKSLITVVSENSSDSFAFLNINVDKIKVYKTLLYNKSEDPENTHCRIIKEGSNSTEHDLYYLMSHYVI